MVPNSGPVGPCKAQPAKPDTLPAATGRRPIHVEPLHDLSVVGRLGLPLGTVTSVRATVIAGRGLDKGYDTRYLLRVTHVADRERDPPAVMEFDSPSFVAVQLANDVWDLYELKHGEKAHGLNAKQIEELERGYVGKRVHLAVYETGTFSGIPDDLPPDVPSWQDRGFGFSTSLVVLSERP